MYRHRRARSGGTIRASALFFPCMRLVSIAMTSSALSASSASTMITSMRQDSACGKHGRATDATRLCVLLPSASAPCAAGPPPARLPARPAASCHDRAAAAAAAAAVDAASAGVLTAIVAHVNPGSTAQHHQHSRSHQAPGISTTTISSRGDSIVASGARNRVANRIFPVEPSINSINALSSSGPGEAVELGVLSVDLQFGRLEEAGDVLFQVLARRLQPLVLGRGGGGRRGGAEGDEGGRCWMGARVRGARCEKCEGYSKMVGVNSHNQRWGIRCGNGTDARGQARTHHSEQLVLPLAAISPSLSLSLSLSHTRPPAPLLRSPPSSPSSPRSPPGERRARGSAPTTRTTPAQQHPGLRRGRRRRCSFR